MSDEDVPVRVRLRAPSIMKSWLCRGFSFARYPLGQKSINGPFLLGPTAMFFWERKRFIFDFVASSP